MISTNFTIIKEEEFAVICALYGIRDFFGILEMKPQDLTKQEIYNALYKLYKKELLNYNNQRFTLKESMETVFENLKRAQYLITVMNPITSENHSFYGLAKETIWVELQKSWQNPGCIRFRSMNKADIVNICEEAGLFPTQILNEKAMEHIVLQSDAPITKEYLQICLYELDQVKKVSEINVRMEGLNDIIHYTGYGKESREIYDVEHLKQMMQEML